MKRIKCLIPATMMVLLSGCGYFGGDEKQQLEQAWLAKDPQLQQVVEQIRANGLDVVAQSAAAGTVSACVAEKLSQDPLGKLVNVEGSLVESAKVAELLGDLQKVMEQDISFDQVASLLQKGADAAAYAKALPESVTVTTGQAIAATGVLIALAAPIMGLANFISGLSALSVIFAE